ncbi:MAG: tRNA (adenosine(37)-N6)-threonylcarbamoyltransferase complex dimerization subunit type 1 TsaB [Lactobacillaceae bacterium]|nr:tRNA (adenosine(37)-N6)-threonylcarbamoyltransferase complex dimerization subunit type 1 TsaB [Lactobacillaceae bacterium]
MKILSIDTSGKYLNLGLYDSENKAEFIYDNLDKPVKTHSIIILDEIQALLKQAKWNIENVQKIALTKGPGSFTGLRIGATVAKIIASQIQADLVAISTLKVMADSQKTDPSKLIIPVIDARNDNVFAGGYMNGNNVLVDGHYPISFLKENYGNAIFLVPKTFDIEFKKQKIILDTQLIDPIVMAKIAETQNPVNASDFAPSYLRKTQAEMNWLSKNKGIKREVDVFLD